MICWVLLLKRKTENITTTKTSFLWVAQIEHKTLGRELNTDNHQTRWSFYNDKPRVGDGVGTPFPLDPPLCTRYLLQQYVEHTFRLIKPTPVSKWIPLLWLIYRYSSRVSSCHYYPPKNCLLQETFISLWGSIYCKEHLFSHDVVSHKEAFIYIPRGVSHFVAHSEAYCLIIGMILAIISYVRQTDPYLL